MTQPGFQFPKDAAPSMSHIRFHWYQISCEGRPAHDGHAPVQRCAVSLGLEAQHVTHADMEAAKAFCGLCTGPQTVVLAVSYLGEMTRWEFLGPDGVHQKAGVRVLDRG